MKIDLGTKSYEIKIQRGLLDRCGALIRQVSKAEKVFVVTDHTVYKLYGERLRASLEQAGFICWVASVYPGEKSKSFSLLVSLWEQMACFGLTRSDLVVTFGGGVVGDLGGFAAATFLRGIDYIQIPTTLLAQVDSSVGGKVAIDLPQGKNLVGAFYQPKLVLIDPDVLQTLLPRVLHDGLAEVIKYGCIQDVDFFVYLEQVADDAALLAGAERIIETSCCIKGELVAQDEFDRGQRMLLNFGHTLAHAVEQAGNYEQYTHGEAVALGMVAITRATEALGLTELGTAARMEKLLRKFALPCSCEYGKQQLLQTMLLDKKRRGYELTLVVLEAIGRSKLLSVPVAELEKYFVI